MASGNSSLGAAKTAKNDEFYTQYSDIEAEMNAYVEFNPDVFRDKTILLPCDDPEWSNFTKYFAANFDRFGLKKLISTSYAKGAGNKQLSLFEQQSPLFDEAMHETHGKLFILDRDVDGDGVVDSDDIEFTGYLDGDGDFRSAEVTALRDEADIIITNPPFSLFHDFISWLVDGNKLFIAIGNLNAVKYVEVFPRLKSNEIWLGTTHPKKFRVPEEFSSKEVVIEDGIAYQTFGNVCWFTNVDHGVRHEPMLLDTMAHNLKFNKPLQKKLLRKYGKNEYPHYSNYQALEVPLAPSIPSDYDGVMGVPISFLDRFNPDQFELLGMSGDLNWAKSECTFFRPPSEEVQRECKRRNRTWRVQKVYADDDSGLPLIPIYDRLFIRPKKAGDAQ